MFEYHVEDLISPVLTPEQIITRLNELGAEGWNLTSVDGGKAYLWRSKGGFGSTFQAHRRKKDQLREESRGL